MSARAVFLDKDGTLIEDVPYNVDPALIRLMPGAADGLQKLHSLGYRLFIISNQSGVARGYFPESALVAVERRLREMFVDIGVTLAGFYYCPHHPQGSVAAYAIPCSCRKPEPGLIHKAARAHQVDLSQSWFIGDKLDDVEAGLHAGCTTVLLRSESNREESHSFEPRPHYITGDLAETARLIESVQSREKE